MAFIIAFFIYLGFEQKRLNLLFDERKKEEMLVFDKILELKGGSLKTLAFDYTYWDEMINFLVNNDRAWAEKTIDTGVLLNYSANAIWIYKTDLTQAYSINNLKDANLKDIPLSGDTINNLFLKERFCHFFINTSWGLMEIRGATVHPTADAERKTPPQGYFFVCRLWNNDYISELATATGNTIAITPVSEKQPVSNAKIGLIAFSKILTGWDKSPLMRLNASIKAKSIKYSNELSKKQLFLFLIFAGIILIFIFLSLRHWVNVPLKLISAALSKNDITCIDNLQKEKTEFGDISRLIFKFFKQKEELNHEISEHKKIEEAQRQLVAIIEATPDFVGFADAKDKHIIYVNKAGRKMCGIGNDEDVTKLKIYDVHPEWTNKMFAEEILPAAVRDGTWTGECAFLDIRDRHEIPVLMVLSSHKASNGEVEVFSTISRNITERKKTEEELRTAYDKLKQTQIQLIQSAKMSGVGSLAAGVAHEINNPLTGVLNNVQLIKMSIAENKDFNVGDFKELLDSMEESAQRCVNITRALLDFGRPSKGIFQPVSIKETIGKILILIRHELEMGNIKIEREIEPNLPEIKADSQLLQQAIFDIVSNARWAIQKKSKEEGGVITIKACYEPNKDTVDISISDTGIGIPEENLKRVFEPFFTTKGVGEGSGLGLFMVYNIIKEHKGNIEVESKPNQGTTFKISLPVV
jgi:PAS domain S-box-containing protein